MNTGGLTRLVAKKVKDYAALGTPELRRYLRATYPLQRVSIDDGRRWMAARG